jgi:hypothetical protein
VDPARSTIHSAGRSWTVMVYLAGDNNLENFALKDLGEMKRVGSTAELAIVAQLDGTSDHASRRYLLQKNAFLPQDCLAVLPEVNTGDPAALVDFITWAAGAYPAEHYALILWSHGAGWKDEDIYQAAKKAGLPAKAGPSLISRTVTNGTRRALFRPTLEKIVDGHLRAILFDDTSADFLDNQELKAVLQQAVAAIGRPLDLLGFDACLMSMLEVHYQVQSFCQVIVGSQQTEPADGWPYQDILADLAASPGIDSTGLGRLIVSRYIESYAQNPPTAGLTQSAVNTGFLEPLVSELSRLAQALQNGLDQPDAWPLSTSDLISAVQRQTLRFRDLDYFDLGDLCRQFYALDRAGPVGKEAACVLSLLSGPDSPVFAAGSLGSAVAGASGISLYLPARWLSPLYTGLDFAKSSHWDDLLQDLFPTHKAA